MEDDRLQKKNALYLIPTPLGDGIPDQFMPHFNTEIINKIDHFIVENSRTVRRFFSKLGLDREIAALHFMELDKHHPDRQIEEFLAPLQAGKNVGLLSEAGVPAVADPGAKIVAHAHQIGFRVVPLAGPSSLLLALMASGLNGQNFAFNGYLPVQKEGRRRKIKAFERRSQQENQTQIFIETPYRNQKLFTDLLAICQPGTKLCIAVDLTTATEEIRMQSVAAWRGQKAPQLNKRPAIFLLLA